MMFAVGIRIVGVLSLVPLFAVVVAAGTNSKAFGPPERPDLVREAIEKNEDIYYFGLGSNMLKSKLENRSICGTKIELKSFEPAFVRNYRLAFNMRGFPPLEPGMGSLEPTSSDEEPDQSRPLLAYEKNQCHGALVRVSAADYERIMRSEGVGHGRPDQGYEEVVVEAMPYKGKRPVQAIALRAREHVRLKNDPAPSLRYLRILREGADELGLDPSYKEFLNSHPEAALSPITRKLAVCNLIWTVTISFRLKFRLPSRMQSFFLWKVYVPPTASSVLKMMGELATAVILLPGAIPGGIMFLYQKLSKNEMPTMMKTLVDSHW